MSLEVNKNLDSNAVKQVKTHLRRIEGGHARDPKPVSEIDTVGTVKPEEHWALNEVIDLHAATLAVRGEDSRGINEAKLAITEVFWDLTDPVSRTYYLRGLEASSKNSMSGEQLVDEMPKEMSGSRS